MFLVCFCGVSGVFLGCFWGVSGEFLGSFWGVSGGGCCMRFELSEKVVILGEITNAF